MRIDREIEGWLPIIPRESLGTDCSGCLVVRVNNDEADMVCNECGAVTRTVRVGDVEAVMPEMAQTDIVSSAVCK